MNATDDNLRCSDVPAFVSFREYCQLRDQDELILREGKYYLVRNRQLRPVHIRWRH